MLFLNDQNVKDTEKEGARSRGSGRAMAEGVEGASMKLTADLYFHRWFIRIPPFPYFYGFFLGFFGLDLY